MKNSTNKLPAVKKVSYHNRKSKYHNEMADHYRDNLKFQGPELSHHNITYAAIHGLLADHHKSEAAKLKVK